MTQPDLAHDAVATIAFGFDLTAVFTGLLFALVMSELLRIGPVAIMVALLVAGGLVWTLFQGGGPAVTRLVETAVMHLETSATTGFLTGAFLGKSLSALLAGLRQAATPRPPGRQAPRRPGANAPRARQRKPSPPPPPKDAGARNRWPAGLSGKGSRGRMDKPPRR